MKKLTLALLLIVTGCVSSPNYPPEFKRIVTENHARQSRYVDLMKAGKTKPEEDKAMHEANLSAWKALKDVVEDK